MAWYLIAGYASMVWHSVEHRIHLHAMVLN